MEKKAETYEQILHDSGETVFNIKRFQRNLERMRFIEPKTQELMKGHVIKIGVRPFRFRRPRVSERLRMSQKKKFGKGDPRDFSVPVSMFMINRR
uniref:Uncharacterized protein n=1 Tax=Magallana gigas TaxID=29159 RepID=A0A8W8NPF2_MAGGI